MWGVGTAYAQMGSRPFGPEAEALLRFNVAWAVSYSMP